MPKRAVCQYLIFIDVKISLVMNVYRRIRDLREDTDLNQKDIAKKLACSRKAYSNYELGHRDIPVGRLVQLAEYYQTTTDYLLGLTETFEQPEGWRSDLLPRIRNLRKDTQRTQAQIAQYLHCSQEVYSRYERNQRRITTEVLIKLAQFHHTTTDDLLGLTDEQRKL